MKNTSFLPEKKTKRYFSLNLLLYLHVIWNKEMRLHGDGGGFSVCSTAHFSWATLENILQGFVDIRMWFYCIDRETEK